MLPCASREQHPGLNEDDSVSRTAPQAAPGVWVTGKVRRCRAPQSGPVSMSIWKTRQWQIHARLQPLIHTPSLAVQVKGCRMPARGRERMRPPPGSGGRRRTSLQGGNRGPRPGGRDGPECYGDWIGPGGGGGVSGTDLERVGVAAGAWDPLGARGFSVPLKGSAAPRGRLDPSGLERWLVAEPSRVGSRWVVRGHAAACAGGGARMCGPRTSVSRICIGAPQSGQT